MSKMISRIFDKIKPQDEAKVELAKVNVELAESADALVKEVTDHYNNISDAQKNALTLFNKLQNALLEEVMGSAGELEMMKSRVNTRLGQLEKIANLMEDADLDESEVRRSISLLDEASDTIVLGIKMASATYDKIINGLKL